MDGCLQKCEENTDFEKERDTIKIYYGKNKRKIREDKTYNNRRYLKIWDKEVK